MYEYDLSADRNVTDDGEGAPISVGSFDGDLALEWDASQECCNLPGSAPQPSVDEEICTDSVRRHTRRTLLGSSHHEDAEGATFRTPLDQTTQPQHSNSAGTRAAPTASPTPAAPRVHARANSRACSNPRSSAPTPSQSGSKMTLASAFSASTEGRFHMMQSHLAIEQQRMEQEDARAEKQEERADRKEENEHNRFKEQLEWDRKRYDTNREDRLAEQKAAKEEKL
jgi:hypothetical protein